MLTRFMVVAGLFFLFASRVYGDEIQYAHIYESKGDTVTLLYQSPGGDQYYTCTTDGDCGDGSTHAKDIYPSILGSTAYHKSPSGRFGVHTISLPDFTIHSVYSLTSDTPTFVALLPMEELITRIGWSRDERVIVAQEVSGTIVRYDHQNGVTTKASTKQQLPFFAVSPRGTYMSYYSYTEAAHKIFNIDTETMVSIPSETVGPLSMSENELYVAHRDIDQLVVSTIEGSSIRRVTIPNGTIADFLFVDNTLYYIANNASRLTWNLIAHAIDTGVETTIARNISYGTPLELVDGKLAYSIIEGKNRTIVLYDDDTNTHEKLSPVSVGEMRDDVQTNDITLAGLSGALLTPRTNPDSLFVWLHGGPQRQTSVGYHSYLSYAVYDELLERLSGNGSYVLKLDYPGSWGYGEDFVDELVGNVGRSDAQSVVAAVRAFKNSHDVSNVYLIGNSYGGYLALRALTESPTLFTGAISINGVTDWYGLASRIPSTPFTSLFAGTPDLHNLDDYFAASIYSGVAEKLTASDKMLIFYGEDDDTVPIWQSQEFHDFAETKNKTSKLVALPDTGHIPEKRPILNMLCREISDYFSLDVSCTGTK